MLAYDEFPIITSSNVSAMRKLVKSLTSVFLFLLVNCQGEPLQPHVKHANEIINSFTKEMQKEYNLICVGSGGRMSSNIDTIKILFHLYQRTTLEEARQLMIKAKERLVEKVNAHKKIRPFLKEYPFTALSADISISFYNPQSDSHYLDGSVAIACSAKLGKSISYDRAELQKRKGPDFHDSDGSIRVGKITEDEVFVLLLEEPYEEALRIVMSGVNADQNVVKSP